MTHSDPPQRTATTWYWIRIIVIVVLAVSLLADVFHLVDLW
ncbi:MAG: hypothetical protein HMLKMBBP_02900 [Planctomycetes bacterium]|nr:hypothetical protein [Planctomycetota bacterium]